MKKLWFILIVGTAAVLAIASAGCVNQETGDILGEWYFSENNETVILLSFNETGTGIQIAANVSETEDPEITGKVDFSWKSDGENTCLLTFADSTEETVTVDSIKGILDRNGDTYLKYPSQVSGAFPPHYYIHLIIPSNYDPIPILHPI